MDLKSELLQIFTTTFKGGRSKGKKCRQCGGSLQPGDTVTVEKYLTTKFYPVKGIMGFRKFLFFHADCHKESKERANA